MANTMGCALRDNTGYNRYAYPIFIVETLMNTLEPHFWYTRVTNVMIETISRESSSQIEGKQGVSATIQAHY